MAEPSKHDAENHAGLGTVNESDIDLLLVLDAHRRGPVTQALFDRAGLMLEGPVKATRSATRSDGTRETDVEICAGNATLYVEDKIDAPFTPGQAASYRAAVEQHRAAGEQAAAVPLCPERQLARYDTDDLLPVSFEELAAIAESDADPLSIAIAIVLRAATRPRPGRPEDPETRAWGEAYQAAVATASADRVSFAASAFRNASTDWVKLGYSTMPAECDGPWHWLSEGRVVMYLPEEPAAPPPGAAVRCTGKRWRIDEPVPVVTLGAPVPQQVDAISTVVKVADRFHRWALDELGP